MGFIVSASVVFFDQLTKFLALDKLNYGISVPVFKNIFHLTLVRNTGIAFGLFKDSTIILIFISLIAVMFILRYWFLRKEKLDRLVKFSLFLILGGAIGNLIDRFRFGYVVDFLDFRVWPVFNVADSCITIGAVLIGLRILINQKQGLSGKQ
ncbi:MAG: signal peptidase II [Candidatus Omnitrophota bacterium]|nr:signal peptidase II [Candidatus Omnitrophota bacterium]